MGSTRIKGSKLALKLGTPGIDYWADATSVVLDNEESDTDVLTFEDAAAGDGDRQYFFTITAIQSTAQDSFWRYVWASTGEVVPFTYAPHGNEVATADQPHFVGTCKIGPRPSVGGEASRSRSAAYTFETRFDVETGPTLDDGV